jgi:tight adherence protein C
MEAELFARLGSYIVLLAGMTFFAGGAFVIASAFKARSEMLSRRIEKIRTLRTGGIGLAKGRGGVSEERHRALPSQGLTEAEHRQIARALTPLGVPSTEVISVFGLIRLVIVGLGVAFISLLPWTAGQGIRTVLFAAFAGIVGWLAPVTVIRMMIKRHNIAVAIGLPDALELLAVCVEAGLSLEAALQRVSRELMASHPAIAGELAMTWAEIVILPSRDAALLNFAERLDIPSVRSVVSTLAQTMRFGTPLAQSLRVVAADLRTEQMTRLEEAANRLPALMTIPVMVFIMPTIFLIVGGPAALRAIDAFTKH